MRDRLRAGAAVYNAGHRHAAHDCWEEHWLALREAADDADPPATVREADPDADLSPPSTTADERLLHGLIQFTAAVHHHEDGNPAGARGLAGSARAYLAPLPETYRDVSLAPVRRWLETAAPAAGDDEDAATGTDATTGADGLVPDPPQLRHEGSVVALDDLAPPAAALAAPVVAATTGYDAEPVAAAAEYAREALDADESSPFVALVTDFVAGDHRGIVHRRLAQHVERERRRDRDVDGLF